MSESQSIHPQPMTLEQYRRALEAAKAESEPIVREMVHMMSMLPSPGFIKNADGSLEQVEKNGSPEFQAAWDALSEMRNRIYRKHGIEVRA